MTTRVPHPFSVERVKHGIVNRVLGVNRIDVKLDLGFGVNLSHAFTIDGVFVGKVPVEQRTTAVHCLVVLLGAKRVLVQPEHDKPECTFARIYLNEKVYGSPLGLVTNIDKLDRPILDVTTFFGHLAKHNFDVKLVYEVINKGERT